MKSSHAELPRLATSSQVIANVWLGVLLLWSLFASILAAGSLGSWPLQLCFAIISVTFCLAVFVGKKIWSWWVVIVFGLNVQLLSGYLVYHKAMMPPKVAPSVLQEQLDSLQEDKYREIERFAMFQEQTEFRVSEGLPIGPVLVDAHDKHVAEMIRLDERIFALQDRLQREPNTGAFNPLVFGAKQVGVTLNHEEVLYLINLLCTLGFISCLYYGFSLNRLWKQVEQKNRSVSDKNELSKRYQNDVSKLAKNAAEPKAEISDSEESAKTSQPHQNLDHAPAPLVAKPKFNVEFLTRSTGGQYNAVDPTLSKAKHSPSNNNPSETNPEKGSANTSEQQTS